MKSARSRAAVLLAWLGRLPRNGRDAFLLAAGAGCVIGLTLVAVVLREGAIQDGVFGGDKQDG